MISVVIPAHNESSVIARTLTALTTEAADDELEIVVVCNGCTDDTAAIAKSFGRPVRVVETELANKTHALNLGDQSARAFPRVYIDADVVISLSALRALARRLQKGDVIAVAPQPYFDLTGCSWPVRAFYDIRCRMPSFKEGIGGSGVYALSENARRRFAEFPNVVADDAYVRSQFKPSERETLSCFTSTVSAPRSLRNLIAIETRADFGNFQVARLYPSLWSNMGRTNNAALIALFRHPPLWPRLSVYMYVRITARRRARLMAVSDNFKWERDATSRESG